MTTTLINRISQVEILSGELTNDSSKLVLSQLVTGSTYQTANATGGEFATLLANNIVNGGVSKVVSLSTGFTGDGSAQSPLSVDNAWLNNTLTKTDHVATTRVGNRKTRYLPFTVRKYGLFTNYSSKTAPTPMVGLVERDGAFRLMIPGYNLYHYALGNWGTRGTADESQLIERPYKVTGITTSTRNVIGCVALSDNAAILKALNGSSYEYWFVNVTDGSLTPNALSNPLLLGTEGDSSGLFAANRSMCAFYLSGYRYIAFPKDTSANSAGEIDVYRVTPSGTNGATFTKMTSWTVASYAGLFTSQTTLHYSDRFLGTGSDNCELLDATGTMTATYLNSTNVATRIQAIVNPVNPSDVYLSVRREHMLNSNGLKNKYVHDLVFKLTISGAGVGSAVAITQYVANRPTVNVLNSAFTFTNQRTIVGSTDLPATQSEIINVLADGSVLLYGDVQSTSDKPTVRLIKAPVGTNPVQTLDFVATVNNKNYQAPLSISYAAGYTVNTALAQPLYVGSDIPVSMGGVMGVIPAGTYDLSALYSAATPQTIVGVPYSSDYDNLNCRRIYLYVQKSGTSLVFVASVNYIAESLNNTMVGCVYYPTDGRAPIILAQAYTRLGTNRLSFEPQGSAVAASYDNPAQLPKDYWMQQVKLTTQVPRYWEDSGYSVRTGAVLNGQNVYISASVANSKYMYPYRMNLNGVDLGVNYWQGDQLYWNTTLNFDGVTRTLASDNEYFTGTYTILLKAGQSATVLLVGGGGGGGGAIYNYASSVYAVDADGGPGGVSSVTIDTSSVIAGGGGGGTTANWGNGSSFTNGKAGVGGVVVTTNIGNMSVLTSANGIQPPILSRWTQQLGGATVAPTAPWNSNGTGGNGAWGVGDEQWSYGGPGGSGAMVQVNYINKTGHDTTITLVVGDGGTVWTPTPQTVGNAGTTGMPGYGRVQIYNDPTTSAYHTVSGYVSDAQTGKHIGQSNLTVITSSVDIDVVSTADYTTQALQFYRNSSVAIRLLTHFAHIGDIYDVYEGNTLITSVTYNGSTIHIPYTPSNYGQFVLKVTNRNNGMSNTVNIAVVAYAGIDTAQFTGQTTFNLTTQTVTVNQDGQFFIKNLADALQYIGPYYQTYASGGVSGAMGYLNGHNVWKGKGQSWNVYNISSLLVEGWNTVHMEWGAYSVQGPFLK